ncbi:MAG: Ppx/GppA family phosphatase [Planctomycetes bacterium]|nr:Ppx/GppA family phosphatase [Planctomycetota bacterium]
MAAESTPSREESPPLAALDLGSNSFHLIVAREVGGSLQVIDRHRERVALGAGLDDKRTLSQEAQDRAIASLQRFAQRIWDIPAERIRVVATNTLRIAKNRKGFMSKAQDALGVPIEIISGQEEARLTWIGVHTDLPMIKGRRLLVDIGGGSTECVIGESDGILGSDSLQLGCVSMSALVFGDGKLNANRFKTAKRLAMAELQTIAAQYRKLGWAEAYGSSGTINAIAKHILRNEPFGSTFSAAQLRGLEQELIALGHVDALVEAGIREDRARVIPGGIAVLRGVFEALKIDKMTASSNALREGLLADLVGRIHHRDVRERSIRGLMWRFHVDVSQAARVEEAAKKLFRTVPKGVFVDSEAKEHLLTWAARVHEIGLSLSYSGYHKHSAYLVEHSEMDGFSQVDQRHLAYLCLCHRRRLRDANDTSYVDLSELEVERLRPLALVLRLAVLFMRSRRDVDLEGVAICELSSSAATLKLPEGWLETHPLTALDIEAEIRALSQDRFELRIQSDN